MAIDNIYNKTDTSDFASGEGELFVSCRGFKKLNGDR